MRRDIAARLRVPFDVVGHGRYVALSGTLFGMQLFASSEDELRCGLRDLADLIDPGEEGGKPSKWRDFATDPPTDKKPVLCKSANGKVYVGNPCFFANDTFTGEVWVPRGDRYRKPAKWMEIDE